MTVRIIITNNEGIKISEWKNRLMNFTGASTLWISRSVDCNDITEHNDLVVTTASTYPVGTSLRQVPSPTIKRSIMICENCQERFPFIRYSGSLRFRSTPIKRVLSG